VTGFSVPFVEAAGGSRMVLNMAVGFIHLTTYGYVGIFNVEKEVTFSVLFRSALAPFAFQPGEQFVSRRQCT